MVAPSIVLKSMLVSACVGSYQEVCSIQTMLLEATGMVPYHGPKAMSGGHCSPEHVLNITLFLANKLPTIGIET